MQNCPIISPKKYNIHTKVAHFACKCATFVIFLQSLEFRRSDYYLVSSLDMKLHLQ